jgi:multidrug efflux pump subunit AcrB
MSRFAIKTPYFIVVVCLIIAIVGSVGVLRMPVDMFPPINIPVVVVATFYSGMPPEQVEGNITYHLERMFTLASGVEHIESRSLTGVSVIKVYFQPGSNPDAAASTISSLAISDIRDLPPGTLPPIVLKFDASSLPVCLVTLKGEGLTETFLKDIAQNNIRNQLAGVQGASVPQPFGGRWRQIQFYVNPFKLEANQLSLMDVVRSVNESNVILPAGDVKIGHLDYSIYANNQVDLANMNRMPIKIVGQAPVRFSDIGNAQDSYSLQYNVVRVDGQRSVYLPVLKQGGDSNTIAVVNGVREHLKHLLDVPESLKSTVVFDQSAFVKTAIQTLLDEGGIGLLLTCLMILIFLGSMRATVAVFFSIPLSVLAAFIALQIGGSSVNSMVLGGFALALSRLIDNSVVVLENIFRHLELGEPPLVAAEKGGREVALPVLAATLTTVVVFFPVTLLYGVSRYLFSALALAVVLSLFASFFVAMTVVPLFCARFMKQAAGHSDQEEPKIARKSVGARFNSWFNRQFNRMLGAYETVVAKVAVRPVTTMVVFFGLFGASLLLYPLVGLAFFPRTDAGQFVVSVKAPSGTALTDTEAEVARLEQLIRKTVLPSDMGLIVSNIGVDPGFSAVYTANAAMHTAVVQASLNPGHRIGTYDYISRVKRRMADEMPELTAFFSSGSLVDGVVNMGMPAPIDLQISGRNLQDAYKTALEIAAQIRALPGAADVFIPQDLDYPALRLNIDRMRAGELGLNEKEVMSNVITALTSNQMVAPNIWVDPKNGNNYWLTVQYPEKQIHSINDLRAIPLHGSGVKQPTRLDMVSTITPFLAPTEVDHYQIRRKIDIYVRPAGEALGALAARIKRIVALTPLPANVTILMQGTVPAMNSSFRSFAIGLTLSVVLLYLILVAQFRSFVDPFVILLALPPGISGVLITLAGTNTTLNIMSLMGVLMLAGIAMSNSILIVEFAHHLLEEGLSVRDAIITSCRVRLRPVLMTSLATIIGLLPMALKMGEGSESYAPLARALIGGLTMSVIVTVFIVPAGFYLAYRNRLRPVMQS